MSSASLSITRRTAVKLLSLAALTASAGGNLTAGPLPSSTVSLSNAAIYRFRIGQNDAFAIQCGAMVTSPAQPFFAAEASPDEFAAALRDATLTGSLRLPYNVLLLRWNGEYVLIDTGEPGGGGRQSPLLDHLQTLGVAPDNISHVVLTHAHFDHCGGLLDPAGRPIFSRASHHVFKVEADFWTAHDPDVSKMRLPADEMIRVARRVFANIDFQYSTPGRDVIPGIAVFHSPGHTPGHMTLRLTDGTSTLYHVADLCHHAPFLMEHASWSIGSDVDPALAVHTRKTVFQKLADARERVFGFHLPFPGLGRVVQSGAGFRWVQEDWIPGVVQS